MKEYNPVGVGIMGFADALIMLGIKYDSQDSLDFIDKIGEVYKKSTLEVEKDIFHFYRRIIAPTGSLSIIADCSSGIEPIFDAAFKRNLTVGVIQETRELYKSKYTRTSHQVPAEWHVKVLAQWQKWVDGGVSKTVNLPRDASVQDVRDVYKMAWELGCKGITVYRDQSRNDQVLTSTFKPNRCEGESCTL
jgi:ribonucleoside-diphosphate reductase alpha chain